MRLSPYLAIHRNLTKFLTLEPCAEQLLTLQYITTLYADLDFAPFYDFYRRAYYIDEPVSRPSIDCPVGQFELDFFTRVLIARLTSKAKSNIRLYESKLDELTQRMSKQREWINILVQEVNNPARLRLFYNIPPNWLHTQTDYKHLFYFQNNNIHYSYFSVDTATGVTDKEISYPKSNFVTLEGFKAKKLIWPEDYI